MSTKYRKDDNGSSRYLGKSLVEFSLGRTKEVADIAGCMFVVSEKLSYSATSKKLYVDDFIDKIPRFFTKVVASSKMFPTAGLNPSRVDSGIRYEFSFY